MFGNSTNSALIKLHCQQADAPIINKGLSSNINSSDFRELYGKALTAESGQALAGLAQMVMMNSTLSLASRDGVSPNPGLNSSFLGQMLQAVLQNAPAAAKGAAKIAPQPQKTPETQAALRPQSAAQSLQAQPQTPKPAQDNYETLIQNAAQRFGLDPHLVKAVVTAESDFNPQVVSKAGAMGLMQLMPGTARDMGVEDPFDPAQNIEGGTKYLAAMIERFDGDLDKALAAYNWGPSNVERGGRYPAETRRYLKKIAAFRELYAQGFAASA